MGSRWQVADGGRTPASSPGRLAPFFQATAEPPRRDDGKDLRVINTPRVRITLEPFPLTTLYFRNGRYSTPQLIETTGHRPRARKLFKLVRNMLPP